MGLEPTLLRKEILSLSRITNFATPTQLLAKVGREGGSRTHEMADSKSAALGHLATPHHLVVKVLVPCEGLEPPPSHEELILSQPRLPFHQQGIYHHVQRLHAPQESFFAVRFNTTVIRQPGRKVN